MEIQLRHSRSHITLLIDDVDYDLVSIYSLYAYKGKGEKYYVKAVNCTNYKDVTGLNRLIAGRMGLDITKNILFKNGNELDFRRCNLTTKENSKPMERVRKQHSKNKVGISGITHYYGHYRLQVYEKGKSKYIGVYPTLEEAKQKLEEYRAKA